jgi:uncharacterized protein HemX
MTTLEIVLAAASPVLLAAGAGATTFWKRYQERKERVELARVEADKLAEERDNEREARTEDRLWDRLEKVETHVEECEEGRRKDREECDKRMEKLEAKLEWATADLTGRIRLATQREVRRQSATSIPAGGEDPNR